MYDRRQPLVNNFLLHSMNVNVDTIQSRNMLHDPEIYPDPFVFEPERHLGDEPQRDPRRICFGFGRRICPGIHLAEASIFSCIVMSLAVFTIEKALDENGVPITPVHENTSGIIRCAYPSTLLHFIQTCFVSYPKPFKCAIKPRSQRARTLITESL